MSIWNYILGIKDSYSKVSFENVQDVVNNNSNSLLINTMSENEQSCLIKSTLTPIQETIEIDRLLQDNRKNISIIIYGKHSNDEKIYEKYKQLESYGFMVYIYTGGLFEWLLLQDIYGENEFPTTSRELDILKYKPCKNHINMKLLNY